MSNGRDAELIAVGWDRRFEVDRRRVDELSEMYVNLGYEVTTRELVPEDKGPQCAGCAVVACQQNVVIYTRVSNLEVAQRDN